MEIRESERFIVQVSKLAKSTSYSKIEEDLKNLKEVLPRIAFKDVPPINKSLFELVIPSKGCKRIIWRVRIANSNNNKGKRGGYRIFYCSPNDGDRALLLGVFPRQEIDDSEYRRISTELVESITESDWG